MLNLGLIFGITSLFFSCFANQSLNQAQNLSFEINTYELAHTQLSNYSIGHSNSSYEDLISHINLLKNIGYEALSHNNLDLAQAIICCLAQVYHRLKYQSICSSIIRYTEQEIQKERDATKEELNQVYGEVYEAAREAMNFQAGEVAHHTIQAGSHALEAWDHNSEANRMEKENKKED